MSAKLAGRMPWNSRYLEYARVHGESDPETMLAKDRETYPGGVMCGFTLWIQRKWREWYASLPKCDGIGPNRLCIIAGHDRRLHQDHEAFDRWLAKETT